MKECHMNLKVKSNQFIIINNPDPRHIPVIFIPIGY